MTPEQELALRADEALFATQLLKDLAGETSNPEKTLALFCRIFGARSVALFDTNGTCLWAWGAQASSALESSITGRREPAVDECRSTGEVQRRSGDQPSPLFGGHPGLAIPLPGRRGEVIYLDRPRNEPSPQKLTLMVGHLETYLALWERKRDTLTELESQSEQNRRMHANSELTARTLAALGGVSTSLDPGELAREFGSEIKGALPFQWGCLVLSEKLYPLQESAPSESALLELQRLANSASQTLNLSSLADTPYQQLARLGSSCLAAPLIQEGERSGSLILLGQEPYDTHHRVAAEFSAGHLAAALSFSQLHQQRQQAQADMALAGRLASVGQMAAGLAHEINNPLGSIVLALDSVHRFIEKKPQVALTVMKEAQSAAERAQEIVRKMLHFSRDSRQGFRQSSTHQLLADALLVAGPQLRESGVEVDLQQPEQDTSLYCNPGELAQVIVNLLLNAIHALKDSDSKRVQVTVESGPDSWTVKIQDQGPGVPQELKDRIFEPFFTTKDVGHGTGLGLHVSRQIAQAHGGTLELEPSQLGACFALQLPTS